MLANSRRPRRRDSAVHSNLKTQPRVCTYFVGLFLYAFSNDATLPRDQLITITRGHAISINVFVGRVTTSVSFCSRKLYRVTRDAVKNKNVRHNQRFYTSIARASEMVHDVDALFVRGGEPKSISINIHGK